MKMNKVFVELESGHTHYQMPRKAQVHFQAPKASRGYLYLYYENSEEIDCVIDFEEGSQWDVVVLNQNIYSLKLREDFNLHAHALVRVHFGEFSKETVEHVSNAYLLGEYAHFISNAAVLARHQDHWRLHAHHQSPYTYADLNTHGIVLKGGYLSLDVIGDIPENMQGSKTHQTSRIMNFSEDIAAAVHPQLLIENNDVEASHAATIGRPDKEQLYYLQSRGLDEEMALSLLVLGYLMPFLTAIEDESLQEKLRKQLEGQIFHEKFNTK